MPLAANTQTGMLQYYFTNTAVGSLALLRPTAWFASLHTSTAVAAGNELANANGYARQSLGASGLSVSGASGSNSGTVTFGPVTGTFSGIVASGLWDSGTYGAGNLIGYGTLVQQGATYAAVAAGIAGGGTGYAVGNTLTVAGGTFTTAAVLTVTAVSGGVITGVNVTTPGAYSVLPANPVSVTGGAGSGASFHLFWAQTPASYTVNNGDSLTFAAGQLVYAFNANLIFTPN